MPNEKESRFYVGRQPIFDREQRLVAYELLFRVGHTEHADVTDDVSASAAVITHCFTEMGALSLLNGHRGFINFSADLLLSDVVEALPVDQIVVELIETVNITPEIVARCKTLKSMGYRIALDDVTNFEEAYSLLDGLIDVIKIDLKQTDLKALPKTIAQLRKFAPVLLAEKVDSPEQAENCRKLGFDLFQGYFYARPVIVSGRRADPNKQLLMRLLQQLTADSDTSEIEQTLQKSPELTYKLIRLVNAASSGRLIEISSLRQAILALGREPLKRWLQILMYAQNGAGSVQNPLLVLAAGRAKLMELMCRHLGYAAVDQDRAFMAGMLSLIDVLFEMPMADLLKEISVASDVRDALLAGKGALGNLLELVLSLEAGDFDKAESQCPASPHEVDLLQLQVEALGWADSVGAGAA